MSLFTQIAHAVDYTLPAIQPAAPDVGPAGWVSNLYQFALLASGLLAFGVIVYHGFKYTLNPGGHAAQSDAREGITQALLGLLLLLGAYVILRTINPSLVSLPTKFEGLVPLKPAPGEGPSNNNVPDPNGCATGLKFCTNTSKCIPVADDCNPTPVGSPRFQCPGNRACWTTQPSCNTACRLNIGKDCVTAALGACP